MVESNLIARRAGLTAEGDSAGRVSEVELDHRLYVWRWRKDAKRAMAFGGTPRTVYR
jgi:hypothetical protein